MLSNEAISLGSCKATQAQTPGGVSTNEYIL